MSAFCGSPSCIGWSLQRRAASAGAHTQCRLETGSLYFQERSGLEFTMGALRVSRRTLPFHYKPQGLSTNIQKHKQSILSVTAGKKTKRWVWGMQGFWRVTQHGEIRVVLWLGSTAFSPSALLWEKKSKRSESFIARCGAWRDFEVGGRDCLVIKEELDQGNAHLVQWRGQNI